MSSTPTSSTEVWEPERFGANGSGSPAPAVTRAAAILGTLAMAGGEPMNLSELARAVGIAKSSAANICAALEDARLVQRRDTGYMLGRRTIELGGAFLAGFDEVRTFYELCDRANVITENVVQLAILDGVDVLYVARYEGGSKFRLAAGIGDRFPASLTATGQSLLAKLPTAEVIRRFRGVDIPQLTPGSLRTMSDLLTKLETVRGQGYAFDDEGVHPGVVGLAVAVKPRNAGGTVYTLGATVIKSLLTPEYKEQILRELRSVAEELGNPLVAS